MPAGDGPVIRLENVHKTYDLGEIQVHALRGVSLEIKRGEFVAVMGASGSGKSTLMNILGCLDRPTKGRYFLDGTDVSQFSKVELARIRNRKLGFVFQQFNLLSRTSALENVELPTVYAGIPQAEREKRARESLERVGLSDRADHHPSQLSGGQQQRVAIARALVNLDILQRLNDEEGLTVVIVTHEADISLYGKRALEFRDGRIKRDSLTQKRLIAKDVLPTLPALSDSDEEEDTPATASAPDKAPAD